MRIELPEPYEKQWKFMEAEARNVGYGGARGGGKSWVVRFHAFLSCMRYAGLKVLIVRRTYPELTKNHIEPMQEMIPKKLAKYNSTEKKFKFINGSKIDFQYCAKDADLDMLQGSEYDLIFIDEATHLTEYQMKVITACCRGTNGLPKHIYYTCNPGGPGHGYIKRIFITKSYTQEEHAEDYTFIQAKVTDNKALMRNDPNYVRQLEALPPKIRKAWLEGSWDIFEGQFFEDFMDNPEGYESRQWSHVIEPFEIPSDWRVYRSYDFGYSKPYSCGWWAVDHEGILYRILEDYGCTGIPDEGVKLTPDQQFEHIHRIETTHPWLKGRQIYGPADPAIWDASRGESIEETAEKHGVFFEKGDNARISGWMQMHYRFSFDDNGIPMMYIFKNCKDFIRTIPTLIYDEKNVEDLDTTMEDHIADETRYMCMARPIAPPVKTVQKPRGEDPLNQRTRRISYS